MSGKKYSGERGVISLTSWKARIGTVSKTIFSLLKNCPEFHIVLVLSEEEFPKKEAELPANLMLFVNNELIEILWVFENFKSFKKILFTLDKYRDVPVISADDDCVYLCNYAKILYDHWTKNKDSFFSCYKSEIKHTPHLGGAATLYPPFVFGEAAGEKKFCELERGDYLYKNILDEREKYIGSYQYKIEGIYHLDNGSVEVNGEHFSIFFDGEVFNTMSESVRFNDKKLLPGYVAVWTTYLTDDYDRMREAVAAEKRLIK